MAFIPGYKYDVFVSYALADDHVTLSTDNGWVTTLVKGLKIFLAQRLGRMDAYSLRMDNRPVRNAGITPEIIEILRNSASFVIILSREYLASDCCQREKDLILSMIKEGQRTASSLFIIERDRFKQKERSSEFVDSLNYCFLEADSEGEPLQPDNQRYYDLLNDLSHDMADEFKRLKAYGDLTTEGITMVSEDRPTVFLADVTDDLEPLRENVKRYLSQHNLRVLPETFYSYEPTAFQEIVRRNLAQSELFVQLLSPVSGKKPSDLPQGYVRCQYELAQEMGKPITQWRSPELKLEAIQDPDPREFLRSETVVAMDIEDFKSEIIKRVSPQKKSAFSADKPAPLVFVNADTNDSDLAQKICHVFEKCGVNCVLPVQNKKVAETKESFKQHILKCDALMVVYGNIRPKWVSDQFLAIRKIAWQRESPFAALAIYDGPPKQKPPLSFPKMRILSGRDQLNERELSSFVESFLKEGMP